MDHKELIVLDFDHTVFNTTEFVDAMTRRFRQKFGIDPDIFDKKRDEVKTCCVVEDIDTFVGFLPNKDKQAMHDEMLALAHEFAPQVTHADAGPFIERHKENFSMVFLTHGDKELQAAKIKYSGLPDIPYKIIKSSKAEPFAEFTKNNEKVYFIDDKAENIDEVKGKYPDVEAYFIVRLDDSPYGKDKPVCECADHVVQNLDFTIEH